MRNTETLRREFREALALFQEAAGGVAVGSAHFTRIRLDNVLSDYERLLAAEHAAVRPAPSAAAIKAVKAYAPGTWGELPLSRYGGNEPVAFVLNAYQLRNLRWLLRHVWHSTVPTHTNTGDWCGEILWALEQAMLDTGVTGKDAWANGPDGGWPIQGQGRPTKLQANLVSVDFGAMEEAPHE